MWAVLALVLAVLLRAPQQATAPASHGQSAEPQRTVVHIPPPRDIDDLTRPESEIGGPGLLVRRRGFDRMEYVPWESEATANQVFRYLKYWSGGEVHFLPGRYEIEQALDVRGTPDLKISGTPGAVLTFAKGPDTPPRNLEALQRGDTEMRVDRPEQMRVGWKYQLYAPDKDNTRVLEIEVFAIEGDRIQLLEPVTFMPMISEIPANCRVFEEVNIFRVRNCPRLVMENLVMDGAHRGTVRGHTLYGGIYVTGDYRHLERPITHDMTVRGCTFRNFEGRGLCAYGLGDLRVENCGFYDIRAQALEVDHFSSGHILNNDFDGGECGVMVNDAFDTVVEANTIRNCRIGVRVLRLFDPEWVNTGNLIASNRIGPGCIKGVAFEDQVGDGLEGNFVLENHFIGLGPKLRVHNADGNTVEGNTHER